MDSPAQPAAPPPRRFVGSADPPREPPLPGTAPSDSLVPADGGTAAAAEPRVARRVVGQAIPSDILDNPGLAAAAAILPPNYNFEVHKTVWRVRQAGARRVALQFPEGLLMYSCVLADILESFAGVEETLIMGDTAFGACCVDDYSAAALDADFLVHYGHSCLVPVSTTSVPCMYVFVDIKMDTEHFVGCVRATLAPGARLILAGTIQFAASMAAAKAALADDFPDITVPQSRPLSPGEVLGCTAPSVAGHHDAIVFVADGRFHLEALMIANPEVKAYRYDPYGRIMTVEEYDQAGMRAARRAAVEAARGAQTWGVVLGTLGRQGNPRILDKLEALLDAAGRRHVTVLLSEIAPAKLAALAARGGVDAWVQIACPRLSIDWGAEFKGPTLNPYEAFVALGAAPAWWDPGAPDYPMDYYSSEGGDYNSSYHKRGPGGKGGGGGGAGVAAARARAAAAAGGS